MSAPIRKDSDSHYISDWADSWIDKDRGWPSKIAEIAVFNPILMRQIRSECTILEIAQAWKSMKALSEYAWNERLR